MLRLIVLLLLLFNGVYFVWSQGLLRVLDFAPARQTEPQRLAQQLQPENLRILKSGDVRAAQAGLAVPPPATAPALKDAAVSTPSAECYQAGLFDEPQVNTLRRTLESSLPAGSWVLESAVQPERWIVYMGKYPNAEALTKKRQELASLNLNFEPINSASLEPGLSLGGFDTQAAANTALDNLARRGVRTAQVVRERAEVRGSLLRLPAVNEALRPRLEELRPVLAGKVLQLCR